MEVRENSGRNPMLVISPDEVHAWLRQKADEAGLADRLMLTVQISVENPFVARTTYHSEIPTLVAMLSNVKDSRQR